MKASQTPLHRVRGRVKGAILRLGPAGCPPEPTLVGHPRRPILPISASCPHMATVWLQDAGESEGSRLHRVFRQYVLKVYRADCLAPALLWSEEGVNV